MKRITVIFLSLIYLVSTSGVAWSQFYCCGKLKETYIFGHSNFGKECKKGKKMPGCCETKTFFAKVKDSHSPSLIIKAGNIYVAKIFNSFSSELKQARIVGFCNTTFSSFHAPPWLSSQPVYLSVSNFRV